MDSLTKAINAKNREAFYGLMCFDGMDAEWKKMALKGFESVFTWSEAGRKFKISTESPDPEKLKPMEYNGGRIAHNLEVTRACVILWEDTPQLQDTKQTLMLGLKDGKFLISCEVLQKQ